MAARVSGALPRRLGARWGCVVRRIVAVCRHAEGVAATHGLVSEPASRAVRRVLRPVAMGGPVVVKSGPRFAELGSTWFQASPVRTPSDRKLSSFTLPRG
jgi:hypothetical protein